MSYNMQRKLIIVSFLLIPIVLLLMLLVYPTLKLLQMSFTDWDGLTSGFQYIGFDNYKELLQSEEVWVSLKNNATYFIIHLAFIPLEIVVASVLVSKLRAAKFYKVIVFMPYIINGVAVAYMFAFFFSPDGSMNQVLHLFGLDRLSQSWLSDTHVVNFTLVFISLWKYSGLHIILFIAAMQSIPADYYEAATIDGASRFQQLRHITVPGIKTVIELILFLNVRGALQVFDIPFLVTNGGPGYDSSTFMVYTIKTAFQYNHFGLAAAMAVTLMILIGIVSFVQSKLITIKG
ncbi:carbohydrate ABC transporter permease [Paenibacillus methanolicus]|uniref:Multiple sugar transport system permease protein n=1 Tax=Paenibacillus methanolicus TaxID=582686 RepID=A0A5S5BVT8_9BACL|nr:sugar ABC transporter permease [Paenibacillus methanolicus]TYP71094.1 multiple sugar transport system permease protein [Paenibacillus methanolicus]